MYVHCMCERATADNSVRVVLAYLSLVSAVYLCLSCVLFIYLPSLYPLYRPKSDTCKTCHTLNTNISSEENPAAKSLLESELRLHQCKAERAYQQLKEDTALSQSSQNIDMITFDLQQSLPTPKLATNVVFYKRQMWTYNLGVHNCSNGKGFMFMWPESVASRGSQEVCSCVLNYLRMGSTEASHLIVYSDACGGQNRNINVVCMWMHIAASSNFSYNVVDHKFMVSGHSYLPNDRDFGGHSMSTYQMIGVPLSRKPEGTILFTLPKWQWRISFQYRM